MAEEQVNPTVNPIEIASEITVAWLSNPNVNAAASEVPAFLKAVHTTLNELSNGATTEIVDAPVEFVPAVPVRSSVKPDYIISLINGRKFKTLKRHLSLNGLTPKEYRERYGLKSDYPMVAANYSEHRRAVAQRLGLGRKPAAAAAPSEPEAIAVAVETAPAKTKRGSAKPRATKAAASIARTVGRRAPSKAAPAPAPDASQAGFADVTPSPAKPKRAATKPRAAAKPKLVAQAEGAAQAAAALPKRGRPKKQLTEA